MIISRTPLRISFAGGGSDIPAYYKYKTGAVVSTAIDKYVYLIVNKKFDKKIRLSYSKTEVVDKIAEIEHPIIRECLRYLKITEGVEIVSVSDIPSEGTGLGSSSSFTVGLLHALYAYLGQKVTALKLAQDACFIEMQLLKNPICKQDQYIAAFGDLRFLQFYADGLVRTTRLGCSKHTKKMLEKNLLLFYTGVTRSAISILSEQTKNIHGLDSSRNDVDKLAQLARKTMKMLKRDNLNTFGALLDENWQIKKKLARGISTKKIDQWYEYAKMNGAEGGKILGAGGGGFLLLYASKRYHKRIVTALDELERVPFHFDESGSKVIFAS